MKKTLALQDGIYGEILRQCRRFNGLEFAVTLFGAVNGDRFEVSHIAGPGENAEHAHSRCTNDHAYESAFFANLRKEVPGIRYIGDLHAHPPSYPRLSGTDYRTIREVLFGTDDAVHPEEYVAGIILPLRRIGSLASPSSPRTFQKRTLAVRKWSLNMFMPVFARNPIEHEKFSSLHIAMVGAGSIGSTLFDILVRTGVGSLTVIDPEDFAPENVGRHVLSASSAGKPKVDELARHALSINPDCRVRAIKAKFDPALLDKPPNLIISTADSFQAASLVNGYALHYNIPAVFGGVWGEASVAEIMYVIPGETPCYECYAGFRRNVEIPKDERRYTDPTYDDTRIPGQAGLWANILIVAGLQFQVILGLVGLRDTLRHPGNVWFMNISDPHCAFQPLTLTVGEVKKGCAVCDKAQLEERRKESLLQADEEPDMSEFNPGASVATDPDIRKKEFADIIEVLECGQGDERSVESESGSLPIQSREEGNEKILPTDLVDLSARLRLPAHTSDVRNV